MKIYDIVLFVFIFNLSLSIVSELGLLEAYVKPNYIQGMTYGEYVSKEMSDFKKVSEQATKQAVSPQAVFSWFNLVYYFVIVGIPKIINILFYSTVGVYPLMRIIGIPDVLALPLSSIIYFIYVIGLYQMLTKSSFKDYE